MEALSSDSCRLKVAQCNRRRVSATLNSRWRNAWPQEAAPRARLAAGLVRAQYRSRLGPEQFPPFMALGARASDSLTKVTSDAAPL
jgi:hypothetical protein